MSPVGFCIKGIVRCTNNFALLMNSFEIPEIFNFFQRPFSHLNWANYNR